MRPTRQLGSDGSAAGPLGPSLLALRQRVTGVRGTLVASLDGRSVAHDLAAVSPGAAGAIMASTMALGQRLGELCGPAPLAELIVRSASGYVFLYSVGAGHVLAVLGDPAINVARLGLTVRDTIAELDGLLDRCSPPEPYAQPEKWSNHVE